MKLEKIILPRNGSDSAKMYKIFLRLLLLHYHLNHLQNHKTVEIHNSLNTVEHTPDFHSDGRPFCNTHLKEKQRKM